MKVVILAGGLGSRLSEETVSKPKPLVQIGGRPIVWHIMKHYAAYGYDDFLIALGYKGDMIKQYFAEYAMLASDLTVNLGANKVIRHTQQPDETWKVGLIDTGLHTHTGGRIRRLAPHYNGTFMATYGDGVSDVDIDKLRAHCPHVLSAQTVGAGHWALTEVPDQVNGMLRRFADHAEALADYARATHGSFHYSESRGG